MSIKNVLLCLGILWFSKFSFANTEVKVNASLTSATVFASGAQLFQTVNYSVKPGMNTIVIENVAPRLNAQSIQVKMNGSVILLDTKFAIFTNPDDAFVGVQSAAIAQIKKMEDSLQLLIDKIKITTDAIEVLNGTKHIILNNGLVNGQGKVNDSIELLQKTVDYYQKKISEINLSLQTQQTQLNRLKEEETKLRRRLAEVKKNAGVSQAKGVAQIILTVQSASALTGKIDFSYLVNEAGWTPVYDIQGSVDEGKVNLNYKALVHQNSGLKWENVHLTISTNNPTMNKTKPTLHPWYASFYQNRKESRELTSNMNMGVQMKASRADNVYSEVADSKMEDKSVQDFTQMVQYGVSAEFKIALPYTLESNNQNYMVLIKNVDLDAKYAYYVIPKMDKSAYLVAQVSKLESLNLVPGKANIYFDGSYMGETYIDPSMLDDTLRLSLGKDPNIIVRRTYLTQDKKEKIIGSIVEKTEMYFIEVRNQKVNAIDVIIQDQIPISQLTDVTIELIDTNKASFNPVTGLLQWRAVIKPRQSEQIKFGFKIKHNKDQAVYY